MSAQPAVPGPTAGRTYETSVTRVEEIIRRLDAGAASLGETLELVREGRDLIEHCAGELEAVGEALEELRLDDLVARLEGETGAPAGAPRAAGGADSASARGTAPAGAAAGASENAPGASGNTPGDASPR
jgi:exodeoxyribonuclease VII small subunit